MPAYLGTSAVAFYRGTTAISMFLGGTPLNPVDNWFDTEEYARLSVVVEPNNRRAAIWTGEAYGPGQPIPKREASYSEIFDVTSDAGNSYIPIDGLPYRTDTPANTIRFDAYRGKWQMATDPVFRFSRTFPNEVYTQAQTLGLLQWDYIASFFAPVGSWVEFIGDTITGGRFELHGEGENVWVWGRLPHPTAGDVQVIPHGPGIRYFMLDTHGNTGHDPDTPTNWIPTTTIRENRNGDDIKLQRSIVNSLVNEQGNRQGTVIVQGQYWAPFYPQSGLNINARVALGWNHNGFIGVRADGTVATNGGHGNLLEASPATQSDGGDPFRICFSFRDRDEAGGYRDEYPGVRRIAINGGTAAEHIGRYNGGPGEILDFQVARTLGGFAAQEAGTGGYDFWGISPDLMSVEEVQERSEYPDFVTGHSPTRQFYQPEARLQAVANRGEIAYSQGNAVTTNTRKVTCRTRHNFGPVAVSEFQVAYPNFFVGDWTTGDVVPEVAAPANAECRLYVEMNGVSIQALWNGQPVGTLPAGGYAFCDMFQPEQFALTEFPANGLFWLRVEKTAPINSRHMYHTLTGDPAPPITGESTMFGQLTATSKIEGTGTMTTTGGWTSFGGYQLPIAIVGRPKGALKSFGVVGASIEHGAGDTNRGDGSNGGGYIRRGFWNEKNPFITLARGSEAARSFIGNSTARLPLLQYCNVIICGHGGNDYSYGYSVENTQNRLATIWGMVKGAAMPDARVHQVSLTTKTNSTDSWATITNQTPRPGFENGGNWRNVVDNWVLSQVPTNANLDGVINFTSVQEPAANPGYWRVDLGQPTADGTHPNGVIHIQMGNYLSSLVPTL